MIRFPSASAQLIAQLTSGHITQTHEEQLWAKIAVQPRREILRSNNMTVSKVRSPDSHSFISSGISLGEGRGERNCFTLLWSREQEEDLFHLN